ncbi:zinc metalloprotease [Hallella multisaccharivorax DSM 17128]|uniref:Zinc metalloprotease n=1 Tax=Hallella multisaccharivorax DSM 17128 TaxID=688246 RepID=F8N6M4_9BACT|nr:RIP metalloprotease RseP [Hallella multisaccharivorax]EGN56239.1 peptidase M50 [Hallella multisaccharivorax DSM 17128]GJG29752.1 zinc metalloprotease [Hallella multisaccharivorax DSM 17128]
MEVFLIKLLQFILSISLLVLLHEGGHMLASKLFGVRVEKFFIFFDVTIGKWSGKLFSFKPRNSDTEYGMGWLPLGGYCKIAGMIDESMDTEQMKQDPQPWEFRTKPAWQRLIIMVAGVTVNFVLALFIYSMIMFHWGESYVRVADMSMGMKFNKEAKSYGFKDHDILLGTEKGPFKDFNADVFRDISTAQWCDVMRGGKKVRVALPGDINLLGMLKNTPQFVRPFVPAVADTVLQRMPVAENSKDSVETPAWKIGMRKGDKILSVNGQAIDSYNEFTEVLGVISDQLAATSSHKDSLRLRTVSLVIEKAQSQRDTVKTLLTSDCKLGFAVGGPDYLYRNKMTHISYGFFESFPAGVRYGWDVLSGYVSDMKYVFTADGAKSLGGFGAIGSLFPNQWDWHLFWMMTAFLSIILAFMNILPIPALDGGHVLFLLYEIITRRKPSEKFLIKAEYVGITLLVLLMIVANLNDILRWIGVM